MRPARKEVNSLRSRPPSIAVSKLVADTVQTWSAVCFA
jgi:hypothetical protein